MTDAKRIAALLLKRYPEPKIALHFSTPLELLVATILSARCTDVKVNEVTKGLFRKYGAAADFAAASVAAIEKEIKPTGFYRNKARMIIGCCRKLVEDFGGKVPDTVEQLTTLPGVGRKTANVVLGSAFGKEAMAVDTHVLRVSGRMGLVRSKDPDKVEEELVQLLPEGKLTKCNLALILHGRETCTAVRPRCGECALFSVCQWPDRTSYTSRRN